MLILAMANIVTVLEGLAGFPRYVNELGFYYVIYLRISDDERAVCLEISGKLRMALGGSFSWYALQGYFEA